tara:strand:- start:96 stop:395 length:300 start_codon:yes stop_codon:yes gene_type:complete
MLTEHEVTKADRAMIIDSQPDSAGQSDVALDSRIAEQAAMATNMAYKRAKKLSCTVVVSKNGYIIAELPDGTEKRLGVSRRRRVVAGVPIRIHGIQPDL